MATRNREIADLGLRQTSASTERSARNTYWDLVFAVAFLDVQRQSLELAEESLRNNRPPVEVGRWCRSTSSRPRRRSRATRKP